MQWPPIISSFVFSRMAELVNGGVDIQRGIRDKSLGEIYKSVLLFCGTKVTTIQVYNHLRKWRNKQNTLRSLDQVEGVEWQEESTCFMMDEDMFIKHVRVSYRNSTYSISSLLTVMLRLTLLWF